MSELDSYSDLFAEGGSFDIPSNFGVGMTFKMQNGSKFHYDFEQINYTDVASISNPLSNIFSCPIVNPASMSTAGCLGGSNGAGFGWSDVSVHKFGYEFSLAGSPDVRYRLGYSIGENPISDADVLFNVLAPGVIENHITAGFTRKLPGGEEYSVSFMYAPEEGNTATSPFDPTQTIEIRMDQWEMEFAYSW
jgi:long-chain fatty acid transport protein